MNARNTASAVPGLRALESGPFLFEVAWEVCSKVGGIYTVLRSKAPATTRRWKDAYCLIGPYREESARVEVERHDATGFIRQTLDELARNGIRVQFGRWLITGRPQVLLIDLQTVLPRLAEIKYLLWKDNGIGSPAGDREYDEVVAFGHAVTEFLAALQQRVGAQPVLAHFHEWQGAAALPMLRRRQIRVATVFTTHATQVGRNLSAANAELYEHMPFIDGGAVAREHGFEHRHALECAAAQQCHVFTTVSGVTGLEATHFLGRQPDALVPNGLNVERFAAPHEFQVLHRTNKERIHEFVMGHFFPSYSFDLEKTLYLFTAGRYEYRNKGLDVFIESLYELNRRMRAEESDVTVVAFIVSRAPYRALNIETLNRQAMRKELRDTCESIQEEMGRHLFHSVARGQLPTIEDLLDEYATVRLKRLMYAWRSRHMPTIVTHDLYDDARDPVLNHLRCRGLVNMPGDCVKVIFHPEFFSTASPLLALDYDEFVRGCHMGVFPSYYEPWGYTPLECVVSGVPAITSDLSGFGDYVQERFPDHDENGLYVARRRNRPFHETVAQIVDWLYEVTLMGRRERISQRNRVEAYAQHFDWGILDQHYVDARRMALERVFGPGHAIPVDPDFAEAQDQAVPGFPVPGRRPTASPRRRRGVKR